MAVGKTFTSDTDPTTDGLALTYVLPASKCDLSCAFCFIRQRNEATVSALQPEHYVSFLESVASAYPVRVSGIQGYEPLLDETWPYTSALLKRSRELAIPTSMVTNGTHLAGRAADLVKLGLKDLTVSLDSWLPEVHDRLRGVRGSFARTVAGIRKAMGLETLCDRLVVASVLLPGKRRYLDGVPKLLSEIGVRYFGVTPFIHVPQSGLGRILQDHSALMNDLESLRAECERWGVQFVVDDELARFRNLFDGTNKFMIHSLSRPDRLVRLTPSGACSIGIDVLREVSSSTPVWVPEAETGAAFLRRLRIEGNSFEEALVCAAA